MIILIVGLTGAGKTNCNKRLETVTVAAVHSKDDWMKPLEWKGMPGNPDNQWFIDNQQAELQMKSSQYEN